MSPDTPPIGSVVWRDLTVPNADAVRKFYSAVVGWASSPQSMGDYDDYNMQIPATGRVAHHFGGGAVDSSLPSPDPVPPCPPVPTA